MRTYGNGEFCPPGICSYIPMGHSPLDIDGTDMGGGARKKPHLPVKEEGFLKSLIGEVLDDLRIHAGKIIVTAIVIAAFIVVLFLDGLLVL